SPEAVAARLLMRTGEDGPDMTRSYYESIEGGNKKGATGWRRLHEPGSLHRGKKDPAALERGRSGAASPSTPDRMAWWHNVTELRGGGKGDAAGLAQGRDRPATRQDRAGR